MAVPYHPSIPAEHAGSMEVERIRKNLSAAKVRSDALTRLSKAIDISDEFQHSVSGMPIVKWTGPRQALVEDVAIGLGSDGGVYLYNYDVRQRPKEVTGHMLVSPEQFRVMMARHGAIVEEKHRPTFHEELSVPKMIEELSEGGKFHVTFHPRRGLSPIPGGHVRIYEKVRTRHAALSEKPLLGTFSVRERGQGGKPLSRVAKALYVYRTADTKVRDISHKTQ